MRATDENQPPDPRDPGQPTDPINNSGDALLRQTQYLYALVLLVAFVTGAAWYSVYNAKKEEDVIHTTIKGPGGKPLPTTKRKKRDDGERKLGPRFGPTAKNVFRYLAAVLFLSYVGTGVSMFIHAFWHENPYKWSKEGLPWAGEGSVVRSSFIQTPLPCDGQGHDLHHGKIMLVIRSDIEAVFLGGPIQPTRHVTM